jgi:RES domain-containing protein
MILWRISNHRTLDGYGGLIAPARWHSLGRRIIYLSETPAGALLEALVHLELDIDSLPSSYQLLKIEAPESLEMKQLSEGDLPKDWVTDHASTREAGDSWLASRETALLQVPSAIVPETFNVLLNPEHEHARQLKVLGHNKYPWDRRLFGRHLL